MKIGPRTDEHENQYQHFWRRRINGTWYWFLHVKISRTEPRLVVERVDGDRGTEVHRLSAR